MVNENIITEFEKLVEFVKQQHDKAITDKNTKEATANAFRLKQLKNSLLTIKKYTKEINDETIKEFSQFPGIGKGTINRINEILTTGKLSELKDFIDTSIDEKNALKELESIVGVGHTTALQFIKQGIMSVKDLKKKIKNGEIEVSEKVLLGIKYYGKFEGNIPRDEITKINKIFQKIIINMNSENSENEEYILTICGSYRREKDTSGDIDVLLTKKIMIRQLII